MCLGGGLAETVALKTFFPLSLFFSPQRTLLWLSRDADTWGSQNEMAISRKPQQIGECSWLVFAYTWELDTASCVERSKYFETWSIYKIKLCMLWIVSEGLFSKMQNQHVDWSIILQLAATCSPGGELQGASGGRRAGCSADSPQSPHICPDTKFCWICTYLITRIKICEERPEAVQYHCSFHHSVCVRALLFVCLGV